MKNYLITTDSTCDLPNSYYSEHQIGLMYLSYTIEDVTYEGDNQLDVHEFYDKMRAGSMPTTSQVNPDGARAVFGNLIAEHDCDILHIAFSSGLSGSYNSARIAAEELANEDTDHKVYVIDSLCASLGEGLLVHKAVQLKNQGYTIEQLVDWLETHKLNLVHNFTVDDLNHLHRGGRVSKTAAVIGTLANIKPLLHVDNEGHLIPLSKVRGRKKSLIELVNAMEKQMGKFRDLNDIIFISHGDCMDDAEYVATLIKERFGFDSFLINPVGPTIGTHSGPGTLALFYMGEYR